MIGLIYCSAGDVDEVVEAAHRLPHRSCEAIPVEGQDAVFFHEVGREVDRRQIAYRDVVAVLGQRDFRAQVGKVNRDLKSTRLTSSHVPISYAVVSLKQQI